MLFGKVIRVSNRWKYGQIGLGLFAIVLFIIAPSESKAEITKYHITDEFGNEDIMAVSLDRAEIEEYANNSEKGGMIFHDVDTKEYQFIPHSVKLKGLVYWYAE